MLEYKEQHINKQTKKTLIFFESIGFQGLM